MIKVGQLRGLLLGTLSESEREALEFSLLADDSTYELLLALEEELIDESLHGKLSPEESGSLFQYLENLPDGRRKVEFARGLGAAIGERTHAKSPFWHSHLAWAAALAFFLFAGLAATAIWTLSGRVEGLEAELSRGGTRKREAVVFPHVLTAGALRSAGAMPTVRIPAGHTFISLRLDLDENTSDSYRAVLHDVDGRERISVDRLVARSSAERIEVPLTLSLAGISTGDYFITLAGGPEEYELLARYDFRIVFE